MGREAGRTVIAPVVLATAVVAGGHGVGRLEQAGRQVPHQISRPSVHEHRLASLHVVPVNEEHHGQEVRATIGPEVRRRGQRYPKFSQEGRADAAGRFVLRGGEGIVEETPEEGIALPLLVHPVGLGQIGTKLDGVGDQHQPPLQQVFEIRRAAPPRRRRVVLVELDGPRPILVLPRPSHSRCPARRRRSSVLRRFFLRLLARLGLGEPDEIVDAGEGVPLEVREGGATVRVAVILVVVVIVVVVLVIFVLPLIR
mmetsp:Transcript_1270/g.3162  ORF Transcript_1270/g.3162 Transcript_1270/m.3162 type:complete len:255 (-) Transcript_1270:523-1287(-)